MGFEEVEDAGQVLWAHRQQPWPDSEARPHVLSQQHSLQARDGAASLRECADRHAIRRLRSPMPAESDDTKWTLAWT